jgi:RNA polymerase sigma-70 factor (ECF subfamily)
VDADEPALRAFLEGPYRRVLRTVCLAADSDAAAEDAVHEAIARACERWSEIEHLDRWVLVVALNLIRSRWRKVLRRAPKAVGSATSGGEDFATVEWLLVMRSLPRRQREVAVLHYVEDLPIALIAEIVGSSEGAVKNALYQARRALAAALTDDSTEERAR